MIQYRKSYKYRLEHSYTIQTNIKTGTYSIPGYVALHPDGRLDIAYGYSWDGASGPAIDTKNIMRPSLVHDALYQLMREGDLDVSHRPAVDSLLWELCREDGMSWLRAWYIYRAVRAVGSLFTEHKLPITYTAP